MSGARIGVINGSVLLEDRGADLTSQQEHSHDRHTCQPVASAHDRGHDDPQARAEDAGILHPCRQELHHLLGRSPDQASAEDLRRYHLQLASRGVAVPSQNATVTALRFFFAVTLGRSEITQRMPFVREPCKLPVVLSP